MSVQREITIYATRGGDLKKITTDVATWGELKPLIQAQGFDVKNLLAAESITRMDIVNNMAILPTVPFRVFLRPTQTKSGYDSKTVRGYIQAAIAKEGQSAKEHFNQGKNYTTKKADVLTELWDSYKPGKTSSKKAEVKPKVIPKAVKEKTSEIVESVKEVKANQANETSSPQEYPSALNMSDMERGQEALKLVKGITTYNCHKAINRLERTIEALIEVANRPATLLVSEAEAEEIRAMARELGY